MPHILIAILALCFAVPAAAQSANDFQLPPGPTATATPRVQGPVDEESGPVPVRPRAVPTASSSPLPARSSVPAPAQTEPRTATSQTQRQPGPAPSRAVATPQVRPATLPGDGGASPPATAPAPIVSEPPVLASPAPALPATSAQPALGPPNAGTAEPESGLPWTWLLLGLVLGGGVVALLATLRARRAAQPPPAIERPVVETPASSSAVRPVDALMLKAQALRVTRSFAFATVDYRLTLINRTGQAMTGLEVGADVVSAHAHAPVDSQLAGPATAIDVCHRVDRLGPSQSLQLEGQVRLPLGDAQVIFQGKVPLLVPLLRVRIARGGSADGVLTKTFVVGQAVPGGGRVQPFNLEDTPRAYTAIAQRELA